MSATDAPELVMAAGPWANNAEMIARGCVPLGYLRSDWRTLDPTWGLGRFWTDWQPDDLTGSDLDPAKSPIGRSVDFTCTPWATRSFDAVVLDGPYKLNGTSTGKGAASCDADYGVSTYARWQDRHDLICRGITEGVRLARRMLLVKCQDQVCSGQVRWQTDIFTRHAESLGCRKVDALLLSSYREQPPGRRQLTARRNYSTLLVFETPKHAPAALAASGDR